MGIQIIHHVKTIFNGFYPLIFLACLMETFEQNIYDSSRSSYWMKVTIRMDESKWLKPLTW